MTDREMNYDEFMELVWDAAKRRDRYLAPYLLRMHVEIAEPRPAGVWMRPETRRETILWHRFVGDMMWLPGWNSAVFRAACGHHIGMETGRWRLEVSTERPARACSRCAKSERLD